MPKGIKGFQKGQIFSEEHKDKLSIATSKSRIGSVHSVETRLKLSKAKKGEHNPNWNGGSSPENKLIRGGLEFKLWRESVFERDNWTCQECFCVGGNLHSHHIKEFARFIDLRFDVNNGITLCAKCHSNKHKKQLNS